MSSSEQADQLIHYIKHSKLSVAPSAVQTYKHMGATLSDAILQAGLNYNFVVRPRVLRMLHYFPQANTTSQLLDLIDKYGAAYLLSWNHREKPSRLIAIANFFYVRSIENENCLREWLESSVNAKSLENIRGVGPKTIDYLKMLVGIPSVAVDRHIKTFVQRAGCKTDNYTAIRRVVEDAADRLHVHRTNLDYAIWVHVSQTRELAPNL
ncbi:MAG TPA: hypothetical protein VNX46_18090 [Candidatus Acidoferrum sp.]|jgi:hypothetical protein|nr:hypothetical protein [Candidatus Acidoferrum sp.]